MEEQPGTADALSLYVNKLYKKALDHCLQHSDIPGQGHSCKGQIQGHHNSIENGRQLCKPEEEINLPLADKQHFTSNLVGGHLQTTQGQGQGRDYNLDSNYNSGLYGLENRVFTHIPANHNHMSEKITCHQNCLRSLQSSNKSDISGKYHHVRNTDFIRGKKHRESEGFETSQQYNRGIRSVCDNVNVGRCESETEDRYYNIRQCESEKNSRCYDHSLRNSSNFKISNREHYCKQTFRTDVDHQFTNNFKSIHYSYNEQDNWCGKSLESTWRKEDDSHASSQKCGSDAWVRRSSPPVVKEIRILRNNLGQEPLCTRNVVKPCLKDNLEWLRNSTVSGNVKGMLGTTLSRRTFRKSSEDPAGKNIDSTKKCLQSCDEVICEHSCVNQDVSIVSPLSISLPDDVLKESVQLPGSISNVPPQKDAQKTHSDTSEWQNGLPEEAANQLLSSSHNVSRANQMLEEPANHVPNSSHNISLSEDVSDEPVNHVPNSSHSVSRANQMLEEPVNHVPSSSHSISLSEDVPDEPINHLRNSSHNISLPEHVPDEPVNHLCNSSHNISLSEDVPGEPVNHLRSSSHNISLSEDVPGEPVNHLRNSSHTVFPANNTSDQEDLANELPISPRHISPNIDVQEKVGPQTLTLPISSHCDSTTNEKPVNQLSSSSCTVPVMSGSLDELVSQPVDSSHDVSLTCGMEPHDETSPTSGPADGSDSGDSCKSGIVIKQGHFNQKRKRSHSPDRKGNKRRSIGESTGKIQMGKTKNKNSDKGKVTGRSVGDQGKLTGRSVGDQGKLTGRSVGDKGKVTGRSVGDQGKVTGRSVGDQGKVTGRSVGDQGKVTGRSVGDQGKVTGRSVGDQGKLTGRSVSASEKYRTKRCKDNEKVQVKRARSKKQRRHSDTKCDVRNAAKMHFSDINSKETQPKKMKTTKQRTSVDVKMKSAACEHVDDCSGREHQILQAHEDKATCAGTGNACLTIDSNRLASLAFLDLKDLAVVTEPCQSLAEQPVYLSKKHVGGVWRSIVKKH